MQREIALKTTCAFGKRAGPVRRVWASSDRPLQ